MALDLQSGRPYWLIKNPSLSSIRELEQDRHTGVVVIGAGITGALAAALLVEAGADVTVLDRRELACGSTGASTALLSYEPDLSFAELAALRGAGVAAQSYRAARDANVEIGRLVDRLGISCGFQGATSLYLARTPDQITELREEHQRRNQAGLPCDYLDESALRLRFGTVGEAAIFSHDAGQVDPVQLTAGLLEYVASHGGVCARANVARLHREPDGWRVETERGVSVHAERVIVAAGYEAQLMFQQPGVTLVSTYALATTVVDEMPDWLRTQIMWDTDEPYHYMRAADGRILIGGGDEPFVDETARDALMQEKAVELHHYVQTIMPWLRADIATVWCGTFARSADGLPFIGERHGMPDVFFSLAYGGNGITFGMLGAMYARDWMLRRVNADISIFALDRHTPLQT